MLHPLLARQLKRLGIREDCPGLTSAQTAALFERIGNAYRESDEDRYLLERSLRLSSAEMRDLYEALKSTSESKLQEERSKLEAVVASMGDGLCSLDQDGKLVFMNREAERLSGYQQSEVVGRGVFELLETDGAELAARTLREGFRTLSASARPIRVEDGVFRRRDGVAFPVSFVLNPLRSQGAFRGAVLVFRDITERKLAEKANDAEKELGLLREIIAHAPVAIALFDRTMRYVTHSAKWLADYGITGRSIVGECHYDVFPDIPQRWKDLHRRCLQGEVLSSPEDTYERASGESVHLRWAIHPWRTADGQIGGIIAVTERIDDLVRARETAVEAGRLKDEFLSKMSHELRTPLNGVIGMSSLLLGTELSERQREFSDSIRMSAEHLLGVINDILDFSKIEAGKMDLERNPFEVEPCIEGVVDLFGEAAHHHNLDLIASVDPEVPRIVVGDALRLRQVLLNLVGNAIKFTEKGYVRVSVHVSERISPTRVALRFVVSDSGVGISPEARRRLFLAFSQGDGSMTRRYGGTGLGLVISAQIVGLMGGRIVVQSEPGRGSEFSFVAELDSAPSEPVASPIDSPILERRTVLVLDDTAWSREVLVSQLEAAGARVTGVDELDAALDVLRGAAKRGEGVDVLLADAWIAAIADSGARRDLAALLARTNAKLVFLSPVVCDPPEEYRRELAVAATLSRPVRRARLLETMRSVVTGGAVAAALPSGEKTRLEREPAADSEEEAPRVLLAEDNPVNQKVALRSLEKLGFDAEVVANGKKALEALEGGSFDLVLMDCQMPEMDGFEATRAIRSQERAGGVHLPIVALTAHATSEDRARCLGAGMDDYLAKPFSLDRLEAVVRRYVGAKVPRSREPKRGDPPPRATPP